MIITKRMKELANQSSPWEHLSHSPLSKATAPGSCFTPEPQLSRVQQLPQPGNIPLSPHPHSHRARPGTETWCGLLGTWPWPLSCHSCHWAAGGISGRGNLGLRSGGYSHGTVWGQHAGREINTKRLESLVALLPSDGMGRVLAGVECGR